MNSGSITAMLFNVAKPALFNVAIIALTALASVSVHAGQAFKHGAVMARSVVLNENGQPILVEYNEDGTEGSVVSVPDEYAGEVDKLTVITAFEYRMEQERLKAFKEQHKEGLARDAEVMAIEEFSQQKYLTAKGKKENGEIDEITPPVMPEYVKSVLVRGRSARITNDASQLVLLSFSVDLSEDFNPPEKGSILLNPKGQVITSSPLNIAPRVGFFGDPEKAQEFYTSTRKNDDEIFGPVKNVKVYVSPEVFPGSLTITDSKGKYSMAFHLPYCPGGFEYTTDMWAELYYANFSPNGLPALPYYLRRQDWTYCYDLPPFSGASLAAASAYINAMGVVATMAIPFYNLDMKVDVMFLSGKVTLKNPDGNPVSISTTTEYQVDSPDSDTVAQQYYDFDGDGKLDTSTLGKMVDQPQDDGSTKKVFQAEANGPLQAVFFSSNTQPNGEPDVIRLADTSKKMAPNGLLKSITEEDLRKTDVLVFREATGELILERKGLTEAEAKKSEIGNATGVNDKADHFFYRLMLRGPMDNALNIGGGIQRSGTWNEWATRYKLPEPYQKREADHLKSGEWIRLVLINRVTGYMATQRVQLNDASQNASGFLSLPVNDMALMPPNLKIWAERKLELEQGVLSKDAEENKRNYIVGQEGASLTSDPIIEVYTEWYDEEGRALPEELGKDKGEQYGLTGRLARVAGTDSLSAVSGSDLANFPIQPGRHTQVLKIRDNLSTPEHFYVHVSGTQKDENPKFEDGNISEGLTGRPTNVTPFLTPLFDENKTWETYNSYRDIKRDREEEENPDPDGEPLKPLPSYVWSYRPEYQFSQYDLEIAELNRVNPGENGEEEKTNIIDSKTPVIASTDKLIEVLYSLVGNKDNRLQALDGPQDLVLALGEEEIKLTLGEDQQVRFENIEHLAALSPEDFLTIRLYSNQDAGNILWEYAFEHLYIESTVIGHNDETETTYYVTADDPKLELKAGIVGYASRSENAKTNPVLRWISNGSGTFAQSSQNSPELGLFDNTLTMPPVKGAKTKVLVSLVDHDITAKWKTVEVRAGVPASISLSTSGNLYALGQGDLRLDIEVRDGTSRKNLVEDGTPVEISFSNSLRVKEQNLSTVDGKAYVVFTGGEFAAENIEVTASVAAITKSTQLNVQALNVQLQAPTTTLTKGQTVSVTAKVTKPDGSPAVNLPVSLSAGKGQFANQELITNGSGEVTSTFTAGLNTQSDKWFAQVGYAGAAEIAYTVRSGGAKSIDAQNTFLLGDEKSMGTVDLDLYGSTATATYKTSATLSVKGEVGDVIKIGDLADPNLEPLVSLSMNELQFADGGYILSDEHQLNSAKATDVQIIKDHPLGGGRSVQLAAESRIVIDSSPHLELKDKRGFRLDIKPFENGKILDYANNGMELDYSSGTLSLSIQTNTGKETLEMDSVSPFQWHRIAAKIDNGSLYLYADGREVSKAISGAVVPKVGAIQLGGLNARIRGFRVYDYSSAPLITFADGSVQTSLAEEEPTLTVISQGNLGKAVLDSKLKTLAVALVGPSERNYASLVTKEGFQNLATQYYNTFGAEVEPVASNPLGFIISSAHAWSWDSVWDGVKDGVGYLIPYEDFIAIGQQLIYLANNDPRFDATTLAFASIGAATIIPIAKPLKPLLGPIKKVVQGMRKFPGAKHFAGAIGTAVKMGLSGKTEKLSNLMPFILIIAEVYNDPEAFEFILSAIDSEEDLWIWVDYFTNVVTEAGGLDDLAAAKLPLSFMFNQAYAKSRSAVAKDIIKIMKTVKKGLKDKDPKEFTRGLGELLKEIKDPANKKWAKTLTSGSALRYLTTLGGAKLRAFIRNSKNWRVNRWVVLASVIYLAEEQAAGRLKIDETKWLRLAADVFSERPWMQHGAIFQLSQIAYYHLQKEGSIKDIELIRPAYMLMSEKNNGLKPYNRRIDIVLNVDGGGEEWVETKSLAGPFLKNWFTQKLEGKSESGSFYDSEEDRSYFRQFFHDMRLNDGFINRETRDLIVPSGQTNKKYTWYFQDFKTNTGSKSPIANDEKTARDEFCKPPLGVVSAKLLYRYNFVGGPKTIQNLCKAQTSNISLRDTKSYFEEIFVKYADKLDVKDMIDIAKELSD
jgi:hypothetical protein